ncbi:MAG TPA: DUF3892 domain-containing protein, partial [Pyrinomonadaceae bacterium]
DHTHIVKATVHKDPGVKTGSGKVWPRTKVVSAIEQNTTFVTIFKKGDGWRKGQNVHVVRGPKYIRTDMDDETMSDDLEDLK